MVLHPGIGPKPMWDAYYIIFGSDAVATALASQDGAGLAMSQFKSSDLRYPGLLIDIGRLKIVGHQREAMPMRTQEFDGMLDASMFGSERSLGEMLRSQVWAANSGFFAIRPTLETIST